MKIDIHFKKAAIEHEALIFEWLLEPHIIEFWDNSQEHRDDIKNFIYGKKQTYFAGTTKYWIGYIKEDNAEYKPYCFILSDILDPNEEGLSDIHKKHMSKNGNNVSIDFGIPNTKYLGKGLAASTLVEFMSFYKNEIDPSIAVFFIDPDKNNPRAMHVYEKAGFLHVGEYMPQEGAFIDHTSLVMIKKV